MYKVNKKSVYFLETASYNFYFTSSLIFLSTIIAQFILTESLDQL